MAATTNYTIDIAAEGNLWAIETSRNDGARWIDDGSANCWTQELAENVKGHPQLTTGKMLVSHDTLGRFVVDSEADIQAAIEEMLEA